MTLTLTTLIILITRDVPDHPDPDQKIVQNCDVRAVSHSCDVLSRQCDWGLFLGTVRLGEVSLSAEGLTAVLERMEVRGYLL